MHYVREVKVRYTRKIKTKTDIRSAGDVAKFVRTKILQDNSKEHVVLLCLDGSHSVAAYNIVSIGSATSAIVHPREVFQPAILAGSVSIILVHNHPSGSTEPSVEDVKTTEMLKEAGKMVGIKLLDHVIVGDHSHYSFQERGAL